MTTGRVVKTLIEQDHKTVSMHRRISKVESAEIIKNFMHSVIHEPPKTEYRRIKQLVRYPQIEIEDQIMQLKTVFK